MTKDISSMKIFFSDMKRFFPLLKNLVSKDFKIKYRRSALGVAWSVLNPLLTMIVLTQVFSMLLRIQVENFATYYIVGSALWTFFSEATSSSLSCILSSGALIRKVYIPKYIFPLEKCLFSLVNFSFSLVAVLLVMFIQGVYPTWTALLFPIPVFYCFIFVCGMCLFLSAVTVYFRDVEHLYGVLLTMWIYLTPLLYPISLLDGHPYIQKVVMINPLTHYVQYFRNVVMYGVIPGLKENLLCLAMSLVVFAFGVLVFKKAEGKFILHL
ncbi:MAG: ABC transporter permease [Acutalibacteraceae bacterium]